MSSILLTGADCVLGRHILAELRSACPDQEVFVLSGAEHDLSDRYAMLNLFDSIRPSAVVHLASTLDRNDLWFEVADRINVDLLSLLVLSEAAASVGCNSFTTVAPARTYPLGATVPLVEADYMSGEPSRMDAPLAQVARAAVVLGESYRWQFGMISTHIVHGLIFGELTEAEDEPNLPSDIIKMVSRAKRLREQTVTVDYEGAALLDVIYAGDLARSVIATTMAPRGGVVNISTGEVSVRAFAQAAARAIGYQGFLHFGETPLDSRVLSTDLDSGLNSERLSLGEALNLVALHLEAKSRHRLAVID